jgi:hypothetical protein
LFLHKKDKGPTSMKIFINIYSLLLNSFLVIASATTISAQEDTPYSTAVVLSSLSQTTDMESREEEEDSLDLNNKSASNSKKSTRPLQTNLMEEIVSSFFQKDYKEKEALFSLLQGNDKNLNFPQKLNELENPQKKAKIQPKNPPHKDIQPLSSCESLIEGITSQRKQITDQIFSSSPLS